MSLILVTTHLVTLKFLYSTKVKVLYLIFTSLNSTLLNQTSLDSKEPFNYIFISVVSIKSLKTYTHTNYFQPTQIGGRTNSTLLSPGSHIHSFKTSITFLNLNIITT